MMMMMMMMITASQQRIACCVEVLRCMRLLLVTRFTGVCRGTVSVVTSRSAGAPLGDAAGTFEATSTCRQTAIPLSGTLLIL
jgi:hypothetical protein